MQYLLGNEQNGVTEDGEGLPIIPGNIQNPIIKVTGPLDGTITFLDSADGINYGTLSDEDGNPFEITAENYLPGELTTSFALYATGDGQFLKAKLFGSTNSDVKVTFHE